MHNYSSFVFLIIYLMLVGCSDSEQNINTDYSALKVSTLKDAPLAQPSNSDFERYIKNGLRLRLRQHEYPVMFVDTAADGSFASQFSTTNVHEIGVDEADRLKYDGEYLYQVNLATFNTESGSSNNSIKILKTNTQEPSTQLVAEIINENESLQISDIYLRPQENQLIAIKNTQFHQWYTSLADSDWLWGSGKTQVQLYDVQTPNMPNEQWKIELEGNLEGSRRVGNMLYLVTRYVPNVGDINYSATSEEDKISNERLILSTPLSDLLPHYQTNDGAIRSLVSAQNCLVSEETETTEGYADILTLSAVDLDSRRIVNSVCMNTRMSGIYSSSSGFYIGGSDDSTWLGFSSFTVIHKFNIGDNSNGIEYRASKSIAGVLGWNDPSFRMNEYENNLRVVSSYFNQASGTMEHQLNILREDGSQELQTISSLPNEVNPAPIGKPGESIFAVRFLDQRAYIVTFERIDPLYVIDLSIPANPFVAGELEIPGVSRYLHPLSENWLLGIGNEANNGVLQGIKLELYDVTDPTNPVVKNKLVFGDFASYSPATTDLRSISLLNVNDRHKRLAIPINIWEQQSESSFSRWKESGLFLFEINSTSNESSVGTNENTEQMNLEFSGKIIAESPSEDQGYPQHPQYSWMSRSKLHDEAIFYLHGNQVISSLWEDLTQE